MCVELFDISVHASIVSVYPKKHGTEKGSLASFNAYVPKMSPPPTQKNKGKLEKTHLTIALFKKPTNFRKLKKPTDLMRFAFNPHNYWAF